MAGEPPRPNAVDNAPIPLETAQAIVARYDGSLRATAVEPLGGGVKSNVWRIVCDGDRQFALKSYKSDHTAALKHEQAFYDAVGDRSGLAIPQLFAAEADCAELPHGYALMSVLGGEPLGRKIFDIDADEVRAVYRQVGAFQRVLHQHSQPSFGLLPLGQHGASHSNNTAFMDERFGFAIDGFRRLGGNRYLCSRVELYLAANRHLFEQCAAPVLCHGDCHEANMIVRRDEQGELKLSGVIDFEISLAGDPVFDLAQTYHSALRKDEQLLTALVEGYGGLQPGWRKRFDLYVVYFALQLWCWYLDGGSRAPLPKIERHIAGIVGASRPRMIRSTIGTRLRGY